MVDDFICGSVIRGGVYYPILMIELEPSSSSLSSQQVQEKSESDEFPGWAIAIIVVGGVVIIAVGLLAGLIAYRHRNKSKFTTTYKESSNFVLGGSWPAEQPAAANKE